MGKPKLEECRRALIVEGYSDLLFYAEIIEPLELDDPSAPDGRIFIKEFNGSTDLLVKLEAFLTPALLAEKTAIGIIVDADGNPTGAFTSLQSRLAQLTGVKVPKTGEWAGSLPRIGLFLAPGGNRKGEVETLAWSAFAADPANAGVTACVVAYRECMERAGKKPKSLDKALVGALLAVLNDEDPRLGPGSRAGAFDFRQSEFDELRSFLEGFRA